MIIGKKIPDVTFHTRVRDESIDDPNPFRWQDMTTDDYFSNKRVVLFSLPGAFTPTCSTFQLPNFEKLYSEFRQLQIDAIYCLSVNDAFVMNAWSREQKLKNVILIPDGSGEFTRKMGMLVYKDNLGFGMRSWRYAAIINDKIVEKWFEEEGFSDNCNNDPYFVSSPQNILKNLQETKEKDGMH
ncbi:MAG: Redoxin domain-containing protein [Candidatus Tokpelaia sp. JSC188]|nr:MAG: Redoxin domain-containing protein [Candidatus Tokpelaia sp. JSC188]